jgi:4-alpha-glucanotransferase
MTRALENLARRSGIQTSYELPDGTTASLSEGSLGSLLAALGGEPPGEDAAAMESAGASAPRASSNPCHIPDWLPDHPAWGVAAQLYELRSSSNWGIGDFADLAALCRVAADAGADFVGLNPLHALFLAEPERCSPFSPSNRRFLNPLYIAVDKVGGFVPEMANEHEISRLRADTFVDYAAVAALKIGVLEQIWRLRAAEDAAVLDAFRAEEGVALENHATFEALSAHMKAAGQGAGWQSWPEAFRDIDSKEVRSFAKTASDAITFHVWLQWLARGQLAAASSAARQAGMRIGLYLDLAVGEAPDGSATWSDPGLVARGVTIGAPPDLFSARGQDWGLAPLSPRRLSALGLQPYRSLMAAVMRDAGALRIDHAMSLRRLFWIPAGRPAMDGGFVSYPMDGMIEVLAQCSHAHGTLVVGEDLGHVPEGFRNEMERAGILSYRILYFERDEAGFTPPARWPRLALACLSTHDLPTLKGWWAGNDIALRRQHALIDAPDAERQTIERARERRDMLAALAAVGLVDPTADLAVPDEPGEVPHTVVVAAQRYVARAPSLLAAVRLADMTGEEHPTNLPGIAEGYPNWRRRLHVSLEELPSAPLFRAVTAALRTERPR